MSHHRGTCEVRLAEDVERVRAVREALGPEVRLMIDSNGAWDVPTAVAMGRALVRDPTVFLLDERSQLLKPVACDVLDYRDEVMAIRLTPGQGITGSVFLTGVGEIVQDSEADPRALKVPGTPNEESSLLCVPLIARQRVMGVITLARLGAQRRPFDPEDLELATLFASQCSAAIQNPKTAIFDVSDISEMDQSPAVDDSHRRRPDGQCRHRRRLVLFHP